MKKTARRERSQNYFACHVADNLYEIAERLEYTDGLLFNIAAMRLGRRRNAHTPKLLYYYEEMKP